MTRTIKRTITALAVFVLTTAMAGCSDATVASNNLSQDSDNFKIARKIVFYNGITDNYILTIEGYCSIHVDTGDKQLEVTCKTGDDQYKKHYLGLSDNVTYFVEQVDSANVSKDHYRIVLKPKTVLPEFEVR